MGRLCPSDQRNQRSVRRNALALTLALKHPPEIHARYNIAPTQRMVRLNRDGEREISQVRWGLVPFSAKDASIGSKMINARSETIATKPGFREAYKKARCLIPASGFYEWAKMTDGSKQPVRIAMRDEEPFAFAGLWSRRGPKGGDQIVTCAIITTEAKSCASPFTTACRSSWGERITSARSTFWRLTLPICYARTTRPRCTPIRSQAASTARRMTTQS